MKFHPFLLIPVFIGTVFMPSLRAQMVTNLGNVLALGDSITDGFGGNGLGYEAVLKTDLNGAGYSFTFVGTQALMGEPNGTPQDGVPGEVISTTDPTLPPSDNLHGLGGLQQDAPVFLSQLSGEGETPNYILLLIGTNDLLLNFNPANAGNRLGTLISTLSAQAPAAHIIVATVPPNTNNTYAETTFNPNPGPSIPIEPLVLQYNAQIPGVVAAHQALGQNVTYVDFFTALTADEAAHNRSDLSDGTHPDQDGYNVLASTFAGGIEAVAVPEPSTWVLLGASVILLAYLRRVPGCLS